MGEKKPFNVTPDFDMQWVENNLIRRADLVQFMQQNLRMIEHHVPEGCVGKAWCIDGWPRAADVILAFLKERKVNRGLKTKEEINGKKADKEGRGKKSRRKEGGSERDTTPDV